MNHTSIKTNLVQKPKKNKTQKSKAQKPQPSKAIAEDNISTCSKETCNTSIIDALTDCSDNVSVHSNEHVEDLTKKNEADQAKYKTEMCKKWSVTGDCPYGKKCRFAHGKAELMDKPVVNPTTYRTKKCNAFHNKMHCKYGVRCLFAHEARTLAEISAKASYKKYMCCPELLECSEIMEKKRRLPVFHLKATEKPRGFNDIVFMNNFKNDEEEFGYLMKLF